MNVLLAVQAASVNGMQIVPSEFIPSGHYCVNPDLGKIFVNPDTMEVFLRLIRMTFDDQDGERAFPA